MPTIFDLTLYIAAETTKADEKDYLCRVTLVNMTSTDGPTEKVLQTYVANMFVTGMIFENNLQTNLI